MLHRTDARGVQEDSTAYDKIASRLDKWSSLRMAKAKRSFQKVRPVDRWRASRTLRMRFKGDRLEWNGLILPVTIVPTTIRQESLSLHRVK